GFNVMLNNFEREMSLDLEQRMTDSFLRGMAVFAKAPARIRMAYWDIYSVYAFDAPPDSPPTHIQSAAEDAALLPSARMLQDIADHLAETVLITRELAPYWRMNLANMFEHFVFRIEGDPFPSIPGAFEQMLLRLPQTLAHLVRR